MKLDREDIEEIVSVVVEALREALPEHAAVPSARFVDAAFVATKLGVDRDWVYANADLLGAIRLGGPRGRLRFDLAVLAERLAARPKPAPRARQPRRPKRGSPAAAPVPLIPYEPQRRLDGQEKIA